MHEKLMTLLDLHVYPASIQTSADTTYFFARDGRDKIVGAVGMNELDGKCGGELDGKSVTIGPASHKNAQAIRRALPWTAPKLLGLSTSIGLGDRLGLATPGHIQAVRAEGKGSVTAILAQQSIREMSRTRRTADQVMDCATWGVLQEGFTEGFGSDADHLQQLEDIDVTAAAGFTMFTIDPGLHVNDDADDMDAGTLNDKYVETDFETLEVSADELKGNYVGKTFPLDGGSEIAFDEMIFARAAVKYGNAVAHTVTMYRHLVELRGDDFELEVSVDETQSPTSGPEHYFFATELKRLGVKWISMAPRFVGEFEKGVDYIGDLDVFRASFAEHAAIMRTLGPYKISIHSGSDKFSIYPIVAELTGGMMHLKTAGTSYLEALRAISDISPELFREILDFARERYETDRATYHVSAQLSKVPASADLTDDQLGGLLDDFDAREVLHVTFGSVLIADNCTGKRFRPRVYEALENQEDKYYDVLRYHLGRHAAPMAR